MHRLWATTVSIGVCLSRLANLAASRVERNKKRFDASFKGGYGTIVVFEDTAKVEQFADKSPEFKYVSWALSFDDQALNDSSFRYGRRTRRGCCSMSFGLHWRQRI